MKNKGLGGMYLGKWWKNGSRMKVPMGKNEGYHDEEITYMIAIVQTMCQMNLLIS